MGTGFVGEGMVCCFGTCRSIHLSPSDDGQKPSKAHSQKKKSLPVLQSQKMTSDKVSTSLPHSVDTDLSRSKTPCEKNSHTDHIIDWLTINVNDCIHLFSDNILDASAEGRQIQTVKTAKIFYYCKIAAAVFEDNVEERIAMLKIQTGMQKSYLRVHKYLFTSGMSNLPYF